MSEKITTIYDMVEETLKIARQIRFLISLTVSVFIAIGSICVLMIF